VRFVGGVWSGFTWLRIGSLAGCCECGDEPTGSGATELVCGFWFTLNIFEGPVICYKVRHILQQFEAKGHLNISYTSVRTAKKTQRISIKKIIWTKLLRKWSRITLRIIWNS
jgi:hypothetical protein